MSAPTPLQVETWLGRLSAHTMRDGRCPVCQVPYRCRPWADAFADLLTHGHLPDTTPASTSGDISTAGHTEGEQP